MLEPYLQGVHEVTAEPIASLPRSSSLDEAVGPHSDYVDLVSLGFDALRIAAHAFDGAGASQLAQTTRTLIGMSRDTVGPTRPAASPVLGTSDDRFGGARAFRDMIGGGEGGDVAVWNDLLVERARTCLAGVRPAAARILVCLLDAPDQVQSVSSLAAAARTKSASADTVKIYISNLRIALSQYGLRGAITTYREGGYLLGSEMVNPILRILM